MNTPVPENSTVDAEALWTRLVDLEDGSIDPGEREIIMAQLDESEATRRLYAEYFLHSEALAAEARFLDEKGRLPVLSEAARSSRLFFRSLLVAAAVLILGGIIASVVMLKAPKPDLLSAASTADARWTIDGQSQDPTADGLTVAAGSTVHVMSGTLKLHLQSGTTMVLQGPSRVSFPTLHQPVLDHGWLWIDSGPSSAPLEVNTPELTIRDIGTRFGVRSPSQGPTEVHLIDGKVEILNKDTREILTVLEPKDQGLLIPLLDEPAGIPLARDPFPELAALLAKQANYATTIRSQNPVGYWRLDDPGTSSLANEIPGGVTGGRHPNTLISSEGPTPENDFPGFNENNLAATLTGTHPDTPLSLGITTLHRGLLFKEDFTGNQANLNESIPDITTDNAKWIASPSFRRNGSIKSNPGSATLGFIPHDGCRYTLDASFREIRGNDDGWIALGFANGQSASTTPTNRFINGSPEGRAWILARASNQISPNMAHTRGAGDPAPWTGPLASANSRDLDLRIVLDTTGGNGNWTATWFAKHPNQSDYTCVRESSPLVTEMIGSIGIAVSGGDISATITQLSLHAECPPNSTNHQHLADGQALLPKREGALSFWVRRNDESTRREILLAAGDGPNSLALYASLESDGRVAFFMENGRYDVLMTSPKRIDDNRWHHLALTWSQSSVDLYLDGKRVARDSEGRSTPQGFLSELRFGSGLNGSKNAPFKGQLDEIAVWDRSLKAVEVHHQFQSATRK